LIHFLHGKTQGLEIPAYLTGGGEGGHGGAGITEAGQLGHYRLSPHIRIFVWGKAVQEPCVNGLVLELLKLCQGRTYIAMKNTELYPSTVERAPMPASE
jgi:hypothetical protein